MIDASWLVSLVAVPALACVVFGVYLFLVWFNSRSANDGHHYQSTYCQHANHVASHRIGPLSGAFEAYELHEQCQTAATRADGTCKVPGQCKICGAQCTCKCHDWPGKPKVGSW